MSESKYVPAASVSWETRWQRYKHEIPSRSRVNISFCLGAKETKSFPFFLNKNSTWQHSDNTGSRSIDSSKPVFSKEKRRYSRKTRTYTGQLPK